MRYSRVRWIINFGVVLFGLIVGVWRLEGWAADKKIPDLKPITSERLLKGTTDTANWLQYGGNYEGWRFSPLTDINRQNVKKLQVAWVFQTGAPGQLQASPV